MLLLGFDPFVDPAGGRDKAGPFLLATGRYAQTGGQVGFAGARVADENDRLGPVEIVTFGEWLQPDGRDGGSGAEIEVLQGFQAGDMGLLSAARDRALLPFIDFSGQQAGQVGQWRRLLPQGILSQAFTRRGHGGYTLHRHNL